MCISDLYIHDVLEPTQDDGTRETHTYSGHVPALRLGDQSGGKVGPRCAVWTHTHAPASTQTRQRGKRGILRGLGRLVLRRQRALNHVEVGPGLEGS